MSALGRRRVVLVVITSAVLALGVLSACGKDGPIGGADQPKTFMGSVGMYSDGQDVFVVFASCDRKNFGSVLSGLPTFTLKDDKGQVLWKLTAVPGPEAATLPPATAAPGYFSDADPVLKVGGAPKDYRIDAVWQPPAAGTMLKFEAEDRLKLYRGSYRYGDSDPPGTIRVDGQASTREALEKQASCGTEGLPGSGTGSTPTTR